MKNHVFPVVCCSVLALVPIDCLRAQEIVIQPAGAEANILINDVAVFRQGFAQPVGQVRVPELADLHQAKMSVDGEQMQLVVMAEAFRTEKRKQEIGTFKQEQRTRTVVVNGEPVEQQYTVNVPVMEIGEVDVQVPAGRKPITIPATECRFFELQGNEVAVDEAAKRLENLKPVFLLDACEGDLPELPAIIRQVVKEDCLIVVTSRVVRENRRMMFQNVRGFALPAPAMRAIPIAPMAPDAAGVLVLPAAPDIPAVPAVPAGEEDAPAVPGLPPVPVGPVKPL